MIVGLDHPDIPAAFVSDVEFGDFGPARKEVQDASGCDNYNVELQIGEMKINGVANESGDRVVMWGFSNSVELNYWLDEDQLQKKKDDRDPVEAPRYLLVVIWKFKCSTFPFQMSLSECQNCLSSSCECLPKANYF